MWQHHHDRIKRRLEERRVFEEAVGKTFREEIDEVLDLLERRKTSRRDRLQLPARIPAPARIVSCKVENCE